jgi:tetratricopeptide (TPR) repeat protein
MDPWDLISAHRYEDALGEYDKRSANVCSGDRLELAGRATALLCLGRLDEALVSFAKANQIALRELGGESAPYSQSIATVEWLLGRRKEAIETLRTEIHGLQRGSIKFTDLAGGVSPGLLLWHAGITAKDAEVIHDAIRYLCWLSRKQRASYWPGPLALVALEHKAFDDILVETWNTTNLESIALEVTSDLFNRRKFVQALFYVATKRRKEGREGECRELMVRCANLENPIIENEWYLARGEAGVSVNGR